MISGYFGGASTLAGLLFTLLDGPQGDKVVLYKEKKLCALIGSIHQIVILSGQEHQHRPFAGLLPFHCSHPWSPMCLSGHQRTYLFAKMHRVHYLHPHKVDSVSMLPVDDKTEEFPAGCPHNSLPFCMSPYRSKGISRIPSPTTTSTSLTYSRKVTSCRGKMVSHLSLYWTEGQDDAHRKVSRAAHN